MVPEGKQPLDRAADESSPIIDKDASPLDPEGFLRKTTGYPQGTCTTRYPAEGETLASRAVIEAFFTLASLVRLRCHPPFGSSRGRRLLQKRNAQDRRHGPEPRKALRRSGKQIRWNGLERCAEPGNEDDTFADERSLPRAKPGAHGGFSRRSKGRVRYPLRLDPCKRRGIVLFVSGGARRIGGPRRRRQATATPLSLRSNSGKGRKNGGSPGRRSLSKGQPGIDGCKYRTPPIDRRR